MYRPNILRKGPRTLDFNPLQLPAQPIRVYSMHLLKKNTDNYPILPGRMLNYQTKVGRITLVTGWPFRETVILSYRWSGCLSDADIYNITTK